MKYGVPFVTKFYTGFPHSCNNVLLWNVITTCVVKLKWLFNIRLQDLLFQAKVLLFKCWHLLKIVSRLPAYGNVRPEVSQIPACIFALARIRLCCIVARTRKTGVWTWIEMLPVFMKTDWYLWGSCTLLVFMCDTGVYAYTQCWYQ